MCFLGLHECLVRLPVISVASYVYTFIYACFICVHVSARNTSSALLLVEPGDMELRQTHLSHSVRSGMMYFP